MPQGWTCPRCNRVNAPTVLECPCSAAKLVEVSPPWVAPETPLMPSRTDDSTPSPTWTLWCGRPVQETKAVFE